MADVYVNALTEQLTEPSTTDSMVMVNRSTNEGKIIDYNKLADVILAKLTSKQYDSLTTASKLLTGAINELDADAASMSNSISSLNSRLGVLSVAQSTVNASSTAEVSVEKGLYLLICYHVGNNVNGMYLVNAFTGSYGSYRTVPVLDNANIAVSNSAFVLTIQNKFASDKLNYVLVRLTDIM